MKNTIAVLLIILFHGLTLAQDSKVPHNMTIGNLKLNITDGARAEIQKGVDELTKFPKYFDAKVDLANQYFPFIEEAFKKQGVPDEIKYLVLQESGLISDAVSTSNAVGYWQFKDFTAIEVGLRVDEHVDERKNILSASVGAAKYIKKNNVYFDNWIYAIQAYQMGPGGALKVAEKRFYGAKQMTITKKTYWYVKKYLAHKVAYENAVGKSTPSIYLSAYKSESGKSLHEVAKKFKINEEELMKYNKWLKKGKIPSDKKYAIIVPNKKLVDFSEPDTLSISSKNVLVKIPDYNQTQTKPFPEIKPWKRNSKYSEGTVRVNRLPGIVGIKGSKLIDLARKGNLSLDAFMNINDLTIDEQVIEGFVYYFKKKRSKAKVHYHVAHSGETLWSISQKYGVKLKKLLVKNRWTENEKLKEGRVLWMRHIRPKNIPIAYEKIDSSDGIYKEPIESGSGIINRELVEELESDQEIDSVEQEIDSVEQEIDSVEYDELIHVVEKGDNYYNIARRYEVEILKVMEWNQLTLANKLSIGQQLRILVPKARNQIDQDKNLKTPVQYHVVEKGESLYSISRKYGITIEELKFVNHKSDNNVNVGEQLKVPDNK